jgi:hypothetical protein
VITFQNRQFFSQRMPQESAEAVALLSIALFCPPRRAILYILVAAILRGGAFSAGAPRQISA